MVLCHFEDVEELAEGEEGRGEEGGPGGEEVGVGGGFPEVDGPDEGGEEAECGLWLSVS